MCTSIRFTDNSGHMYLGRNLDWSFDYGQQVRVMPRGFHIPYSFIDDATAAHAVIGMCIDYKNYPMFFDCGNDAGLAVAGLNFPGYAEYAEDPVDGKTNIAAYEFPLWVAATFSTVDEVEAALRDTVHPVTFSAGMQEISVLCIMLALLLTALAMKKRADIEDVELPKIKDPVVIVPQKQTPSASEAAPQDEPAAQDAQGTQEAQLPATSEPAAENGADKKLCSPEGETSDAKPE